MRTVTVLVTDIQGSTRGDDPIARRAIEVHDRILTVAVAERGGRVFRQTGKGVAAVLPAVVDAVAAAVEAQRALAAEPDAPTVRIAIDTGEGTEQDGGGYSGPAVHECVRLVAVANGGQIICSPAAAAVVRHEAPAGIAVIDLGEHRLHNLARAERVCQVIGPGVGPAVPPLRTIIAPHHNLPLVATSFMGRATELAELADLLAEQRLVTLTGAGGSGKTRLALELAASEAHRFPDGVFFVDLAPVNDEDGLSGALAQSLGASGDSPQRLRHAATAALCPRRSLLLLDNCEHLLAECASLTEGLVDACSSVTVLATSREPLGTAAEQVYPVSPLETDSPSAAAVRLFEARAAAVRPDFAPDEPVRQTVTEICRRLDGLPLGIELAAARAAHLAPGEILARLDDRFRLLSGARRRVGRHQTMRAALDWSYDLLDETHRTLWRRLAVFSRSFTLASVEAVCVDEAVPAHAVLDLVGSLVAKSLVIADVQDSETRYRLLETLRDYAAERLVDAGEADEFRARHRDFYLRWAEALPAELSMMSDSAAEEFEREWDNLRTALDWSLERGQLDLVARMAVGLGALWRTTIRVAESPRWLRPVATAAATFPPALRVASLSIAAYTATMRMDPQALELALQATDTYVPDSPWQAEAWAVRAILEGSINPAGTEAGESIARAITLAEMLAAPHAAHIWLGSGLALITSGRLTEAANLFERSIGVLAAEGSTYQYSTLIARSALASLYHLAGDHVSALRVIGPAVDQLETRGWRRRPIAGIGAIAAVLAGAGETERARALVRRDLEEGRNALPLARSDDVLGLAVVAACEDDWPRASRLLAAAVALSRDDVFPFRSPYAGALYWHYVSAARAHLGSEHARRFRGEGQAMSAAEAFAEGLAPRATRVAEAPALQRDGGIWSLTYAGATAHVKDSKGMRDLARLVAAPCQPVSAIDLLGGVAVSDAVDAIDARAKAAYRARIAELDGDIDAAEQTNDIERAARARTERDTIVDHLACALGLAGRPRRIGDAAESARKTVSARIQDAMKRIDRVHAGLGEHLHSSVQTGRACVYEPARAAGLDQPARSPERSQPASTTPDR